MCVTRALMHTHTHAATHMHLHARLHTERSGQASYNARDVSELVVATEAAAVGSGISARGAFAVRVFDVLPDALLLTPHLKIHVRKSRFHLYAYHVHI